MNNMAVVTISNTPTCPIDCSNTKKVGAPLHTNAMRAQRALVNFARSFLLAYNMQRYNKKKLPIKNNKNGTNNKSTGNEYGSKDSKKTANKMYAVIIVAVCPWSSLYAIYVCYCVYRSLLK